MLMQKETKSKLKVKNPQILSTADLAENILEDAFTYANGKTMTSSGAKNHGDLFTQHDYLEAFRVGLGNAVTQALVKNDTGILSVFRFEPNANPDSETEEDLPADGVVNLITVVDKQSTGLKAFADSLDRALTERLNKFSSSIYKNYSGVLDVKFVSPDEIEKRRGYAILLASLFSPPTRIWQRE